MSDMVETLAYAGEIPWHQKGFRLPGRVDARGMLVASCLDWLVEGRPVEVDGCTVPGYQAITRVVDARVLSIKTDDYGIVQNEEVARLAEAMSGAGVKAWEVGGSLDDGKRIFFCGVVGSDAIAGDEVRNYLTLASSHDGSLSVTAAFSPIRVVCANTLSAFLESTGPTRISIRHTKTASEKVKLATKLCETARGYFGSFTKEALALVGAAMNVVEAEEFARVLFPAYKNDEGRLVVPELQETVVALFKGLATVPHDRHLAGTRWGFYQAVTAALDHNRRGAAGRLSRFLSGSDDTIRSKAFRLLKGMFTKA